LAFSDFKGGVIVGTCGRDLKPFNVRQRRRITDKAIKKSVYRLAYPFDLDLNAAACVEDPAR
jgi:hypothetical protein